MTERVLRVVNVDDDKYARLGVTYAIYDHRPGTIVEELTFAEAKARFDWQNVDFLIADLAQRDESSPLADEFPGIEAIRHVVEHAPGRVPHTVLVTGDFNTFHEKLVMRRAHESGAEYFFYRPDFNAHVADLLDGQAQSQQLDRSRPVNDESVGVTSRSRLNEGLRSVIESGYLQRGRRWRGGSDVTARERITASGGFRGVDSSGQATSKRVTRRQVEELIRRSFRLGGR